jgi:hypothetical protein
MSALPTRRLAALVALCALAAPPGRAQTPVFQINSGGSSASPYAADANFSGGTAKNVTSATIDTTQVTNPAPQAVYRTERYGTAFSYTFGGLTAGAQYKIRLHFAEAYFGAANQRKFNVSINGSQVITDLDIFAAAGGKNKAIVREFDANANPSGQFVIAYNRTLNNAKASGIEIIAPPPANNYPTDNPVALYYGVTAYPWTGNIAWGNVVSILDYGGVADGATDNVAAFNSARDAVAAQGGGVVYFPAGNYYFSDNINLKNGVVIRGETPSMTEAKVDGFAPPTKFRFPAYVPTLSGTGTDNATAFKKIGTTNPQTDSNLGLVWVDINRAGVKILGDGIANTNQNILVFGVRTNNVAEPDPGVPQLTHTYTQSGSSVTIPYQDAWQRWSYRFASNVKIQANANVLVANSRHNDAITDNFEQAGYKVRGDVSATANTVQALNNPGQAVFNYTNHYGIEVNRSKSGGYTLAGTPTTEPSLFRTGIVVRDNWVYHTMRIAITASGDGLIIRDNIIRDQSGKVAWVDAPGKRLVGNSATLENRIIDWSGYGVLVSGNNGEVYRHFLKTGPYYSVDGEGILIQECCGGSLVNGVTIENNSVNSYIGLYKTRDINNAVIRNNYQSNGGSLGIYVQANTNSTPYTINNVTVENNVIATNGNISMTGTAGAGTGNYIQGNTNSAGTGTLSYSCLTNATVSGNTGFTVSPCN